MRLTPTCVAAMQAHALREFPKESCGLVVRGRYVALSNVNSDPLNHFTIADADYLRFAGRIQAVVHSHPYRPSDPEAVRIMPWPSQSDMEGQLATDVPWVIVPTDGTACAAPVQWGDRHDIPDLIGRPFVHGVTDCYALIRDCYRLEHAIDLPEGPRDNEWWNAGQNLYLDNFERAGFRVIPQAEGRPGDVVLMSIRSPVPNHAGVVQPDGLLLHHLQNRLSRREPLGPWLHFVTHWLRHREMDHG